MGVLQICLVVETAQSLGRRSGFYLILALPVADKIEQSLCLALELSHLRNTELELLMTLFFQL